MLLVVSAAARAAARGEYNIEPLNAEGQSHFRIRPIAMPDRNRQVACHHRPQRWRVSFALARRYNLIRWPHRCDQSDDIDLRYCGLNDDAL